jgi:DNA-binding NarL/FixJ family response regulator
LLQNKPADAVTHFQQSLAQIEKLELPLEHALTQYRLGAALEADGQRDAAVSRMSAAYRITRRLGARALSTRIATTLDGLGEHVEEGRHPAPSARQRRGGLTRRQLEITGLIAEGLTNKEIAHRLYLSPRTVDMHVSNILDRLDCRSRTEAAQKARDLGIID